MLRQTGTNWEFENEALLEDFLQRHLQTLLGLKVIAQQQTINRQICDLVAISETGQLAILELKNQEDRYITQQLTRYFDVVLEEKPFTDIADYNQPIRLLAIAPTFHRDNFIDRKYSRLQIEFLTFEIQPTEVGYCLKLSNLDTGKCNTAPINDVFLPIQHEIPSPPKLLLTLLNKCPEIDRDGVLQLRQQVLGFDPRIREITSSSRTIYGNGKSNPCAEICYDSKRQRVAVFLWLPHATGRFKRQEIVARLRIWTDWLVVSDLAHVPKGMGRTITVQEWLEGKIRPLNKILPKYASNRQRYEDDKAWRRKYINAHRGRVEVAHYRSGIAMTFDGYQHVIRRFDLSDQLTDIIQLALYTWLNRL